jgi:hypothetical protein
MDITLEDYRIRKEWYNRVKIMAIYHLIQVYKGKWTISQTAEHFGVSVALASENLKIFKAADKDPRIFTCRTRDEALKKLR